MQVTFQEPREADGLIKRLIARVLRRDNIIWTSRIDKTPSEAPKSPDEPFNVDRARQGVNIFLSRGLAGRLLLRRQQQNKEPLTLVSGGRLDPWLVGAVVEDFNLWSTDDSRWQDELAEELVAWLTAEHNGECAVPWATFRVEGNGDIKMYPPEERA